MKSSPRLRVPELRSGREHPMTAWIDLYMFLTFEMAEGWVRLTYVKEDVCMVPWTAEGDPHRYVREGTSRWTVASEWRRDSPAPTWGEGTSVQPYETKELKPTLSVWNLKSLFIGLTFRWFCFSCNGISSVLPLYKRYVKWIKQNAVSI